MLIVSQTKDCKFKKRKMAYSQDIRHISISASNEQFQEFPPSFFLSFSFFATGLNIDLSVKQKNPSCLCMADPPSNVKNGIPEISQMLEKTKSDCMTQSVSQSVTCFFLRQQQQQQQTIKLLLYNQEFRGQNRKEC